jgi:hypothetical protein
MPAARNSEAYSAAGTRTAVGIPDDLIMSSTHLVIRAANPAQLERSEACLGMAASGLVVVVHDASIGQHQVRQEVRPRSGAPAGPRRARSHEAPVDRDDARSRTQTYEPVGIGRPRHRHNNGNKLTSCVIAPAEGEPCAKSPKLTGATKIAFDFLVRALDEAGEKPPTSNHIPPQAGRTCRDKYLAFVLLSGNRCKKR